MTVKSVRCGGREFHIVLLHYICIVGGHNEASQLLEYVNVTIVWSILAVGIVTVWYASNVTRVRSGYQTKNISRYDGPPPNFLNVHCR